MTYTGGGTEFTSIDNVNVDELTACSESEHCIYETSKTQQAAVGDMLLIKGTKYPKWRTGSCKSPVRYGRQAYKQAVSPKVDVLPHAHRRDRPRDSAPQEAL